MEQKQKTKPSSRKMERVFYIIWKYEVAVENQYDFERAYGQTGSWAKLFSISAHYLDSILEIDLSQSSRHFILIDIWTSKIDYDRFLTQHKKSYDALSLKLAFLYVKEVLVAAFETKRLLPERV